MDNTRVPKEGCYTAWRASYINVLPESDWKPYERIEARVKSGLLAPNATKHVMNGNAYKRAMRAHKITLQSLWQLLMPFC